MFSSAPSKGSAWNFHTMGAKNHQMRRNKPYSTRTMTRMPHAPTILLRGRYYYGKGQGSSVQSKTRKRHALPRGARCNNKRSWDGQARRGPYLWTVFFSMLDARPSLRFRFPPVRGPPRPPPETVTDVGALRELIVFVIFGGISRRKGGKGRERRALDRRWRTTEILSPPRGRGAALSSSCIPL